MSAALAARLLKFLQISDVSGRAQLARARGLGSRWVQGEHAVLFGLREHHHLKTLSRRSCMSLCNYIVCAVVSCTEDAISEQKTKQNKWRKKKTNKTSLQWRAWGAKTGDWWGGKRGEPRIDPWGTPLATDDRSLRYPACYRRVLGVCAIYKHAL